MCFVYLVVKKMKYILPLLFISQFSFAQYDYNCFESAKEALKAEMKRIEANMQYDSISYPDENGMVRKYPKAKGFDPSGLDYQLAKVIGCKMPDFSFFNLKGQDFSIGGVHSTYTIIYFTSLTCSDVCDDYIRQFSRLRDKFQDSLTVFMIYPNSNLSVMERVKHLPENVEYIANADQIWRNYGIGGDLNVMLLLDRSKTILHAEMGSSAAKTYPILYEIFYNRIRELSCID